MADDAQELLDALCMLALLSLRFEVERLRSVLLLSSDGAERAGAKAAALSAARSGCHSAVELWLQAHYALEAARQQEEEG